jgi:hypothetical protein
MQLTRFTEPGVAAFSSYLNSLKSNPSLLPPSNWLTDPQYSEPLATKVEVEPRTFGTRLNAARYLYEQFSGCNLTDVDRDTGLWAWLSLFYFDEVCPPRNGFRSPGDRARHIPELANYQRYYRHLLAGPYQIYRAHRDRPERAIAILCQALDKPGEIVEQLASRQELVTNPAVMELASILYVDPVLQRPKRGAQAKGGGTARRLPTVLDQFDLTWDLYAAQGAELLDILPKEFNRFRPVT